MRTLWLSWFLLWMVDYLKYWINLHGLRNGLNCYQANQLQMCRNRWTTFIWGPSENDLSGEHLDATRCNHAGLDALSARIRSNCVHTASVERQSGRKSFIFNDSVLDDESVEESWNQVNFMVMSYDAVGRQPIRMQKRTHHCKLRFRPH